MLDGTNAPPLLIQHRVGDDAPDGQFVVLFDRIVLEVFVAAVAVQQEAPVGITLAYAI